MGNYLPFMKDSDLTSSVANLYTAYFSSFVSKSFKDINKNIIDPIKFLFDTSFLHEGNPQVALNSEIFRQNDKTISNALGSFHEELISNLPTLVRSTDMTCDVRNADNTLFAEIKNKHNTMNSRSQGSVYSSLTGLAQSYPKSTCYLIEIIAKQNQDEVWSPTIEGTKRSNPRVRIISVDNFYELVTGRKNAFKELCDALPHVIKDYLVTLPDDKILKLDNHSNAYSELSAKANENSRDILSELFYSSFKTYSGYKE